MKMSAGKNGGGGVWEGGASGGGQRKIWSLFESPRGLQRDVVYLG
jgi:hypothetical protein